MMILPRVMAPPAPTPQTALAAIKLSILCANVHQAVARVKMIRQMMKRGFRPTASDRRPSRGWVAVDVSRKAVDNHEAELAA